MSLTRFLCLFRPHKWRRARVGEDSTRKYCTRCGASAEVKRRKTPDPEGA